MPSKRGKPIMIQGTSSSAGKSTLVTALCRIFAQDGLSVAPFKAQNMANNSYVALDGGELGRAQAVQAAAAGIEPTTDMNPILLKPEADSRAQVVANGRSIGTFPARDYYRMKGELWPRVEAALDRLLDTYDVVIIEGAGSPAEVNLRDSDIANMRVALHARSPVLLVGDIDRGGVFASLLGTVELLEPEERALVRGLVINKFRGDRSVLEPLPAMIAERTGIPVVGVVPMLRDLRVKEEDAVGLDTPQRTLGDSLRVSVVRLPHISNFDDFDPLARAGLRVDYIDRPEQLAGSHLVILPGSKSTIPDLRWMRERGLDAATKRAVSNGVPLIGICGGLQMLGRRLDDPHGADTVIGDSEQGLGLLPLDTIFETEKTTRRVKFTCGAARGLLAGDGLAEGVGYEIHTGSSTPTGGASPVTVTFGDGTVHSDGALDDGGWVLGTYIHGFFDSPEILRRIASNIARKFDLPVPEIEPFSMEAEYDRLAEVVRESLDMELVYSLIGRAGTAKPVEAAQAGS